MNEWVLAGAIVAGCALLAAAGAWISRRTLPASEIMAALPATAAIYATFGVIYGVILGQVVVSAWETYRSAENAIAEEADSLVSVSRLAGGLPDPQKSDLREAVLAYGQAVVDDEWPVMQHGGGASPVASEALSRLYLAVTALPGKTPAGDAVADAALTELNDLDDARGDRIVSSRMRMPAMMWAALIAGGVLTVAFTYLLTVENGVLHLAMVTAMAALIAVLLVLVLGLSEPFNSPLSIGPDQFALRMSLLRRQME